MDVSAMVAEFRSAKAACAGRDARMRDIAAVRAGDMGKVFPGFFPEDWPKPVVANLCDTAARDLSEVIAPLPSFNCAASSMVSSNAKKFADRRTRIANNYVQSSRLQTQMFAGADRYLTFGFVPLVVEPDVDAEMPRIRVDNPMGAYPRFDRFGRLSCYMRSIVSTVRQLCDLYPEHEGAIRGPARDRMSNAQVELLSYHDKDVTAVVLPSQGQGMRDTVLSAVANPVGRPMVAVAMRPTLTDDVPRGQFDDVMWIQLARHRFAMLTLEATTKAVEAPIALPQDVQELALGPDAILRSANPEKIRRVGIEVPQSAFAQGNLLDSEARVAARYPEGRLGNVDASIVTGKGVQALMGGFDTQVKTAQSILADALEDVIGLCFALDEALWPGTAKTVRVKDAGTPLEVKYVPSKDINGDHTVDVRYGLMAGLDPNRALIFGLQARGDKLISRDFLRREMPWAMNVTEEEQRIDAEEMRDALKQALAAYAQAIPVYAQQGLDPSDAVYKIAAVIEGRGKGKSIEELVVEAFAPPPEPEPEQPSGIDEQVAAITGGPMGTGGGGGGPGGSPLDVEVPQGMSATGLLRGVAPGQAGMSPGGAPALQSLLAGLDAKGRPNMQATVTRRVPV